MGTSVYFAKAADYSVGHLRPALERVLSPLLKELGGAAGKRFMLKPNFLSWRKTDDPSCTHPAVILECAKYLLESGAVEVALIENPGMQDAPSIVKAMGLSAELHRLGVRVSNCSRYEQLELVPEARCRKMELATEFRDFDAVVNLAKAKTHGMMTLTLGVKNLFGLVRGSERLAWHLAVGSSYPRFADMLIDIALTVKPRLNLLDAVVCMEGNGPGNGDATNRGFLAASGDVFALDAATAPLLGGADIPQLIRMRERGLLPEIECVGEVPDCPPLRLPAKTNALDMSAYIPRIIAVRIRKSLISHPAVYAGRCIGCGVCVRVCPPRALKIRGGKPVFDLKSCIRCYCCQEHCPQGAIIVKRTLFMRIAGKIEKTLRRTTGIITRLIMSRFWRG